MAASSTLSSKGQITLPLEVRKRLGLKRGDRIEFVLEQGRTVVQPARTTDNPFLEDVGILPALGTLQDIHSWIRDLRDEDERA
jgi:AbrB family looped-hinge helix DNA binding protein